MEDKCVDILIVGGGMAGGFLAAALQHIGLSVELLDGAPSPVFPEAGADLRVVSLTEASQRMLVNTGVWPYLDKTRLCPYQHMQVWDSDGTGSVDFHAEAVAASSLGWIVENSHLVAALHARLAEVATVTWQSDSRVTTIASQESGWRVTLASGESLRCRLLVGADGARSMVRESAAIPVAHHDAGHHALVTRLRTELPHAGTARQWFQSTGPLAFLPLFGDGHDISIVWSAIPERANTLAAMSMEELAHSLQTASENALGAVEVVVKPAGFPIRELQAASYVSERLALMGDAAHVIHPLAGQGINMGLLDAATLAEEVDLACQNDRPFNDAFMLGRYQRRRRGHNLVMQQSMRGFQTLFAQQQPAIRWLRNTGMKMVNQAGPIKQRIVAEALGRHGDLPAIARSPSEFMTYPG